MSRRTRPDNGVSRHVRAEAPECHSCASNSRGPEQLRRLRQHSNPARSDALCIAADQSHILRRAPQARAGEIMSQFIDVATADGKFKALCARPAAGKSAPVIVVLQEIFGINDDLKATCEWLANQGFIAVCPDLFWRIEPGVSMSKLNEAEWQKGFGLYQKFDRDKGVAD